MNNLESKLPRDDDGGAFVSNCVDVFIDKPGDTTVRPIRPSLYAQAKAERAKYYGDLDSETKPENNSSN